MLDGYGFSEAYLEILQGSGIPTLVIDDLGKLSRYACAIVVNQILHADAALYPDVGRSTQLLLGTSYMMLRRDGHIKHARLSVEIHVGNVNGRKLQDAIFKNKAPDGSGFDVIAFAKEAERDGYTLSKEELVPLFREIQQEIKGGSYELYAEVLRRTAVQISRQLGWPLEPSRSGFLPTSVSRWPPFKWQLLQEIFPGAKCGTSPGVLVKIRKPHMMSVDSFESSSDGSVNGFRGKSHAVIIVVADEMSGLFGLAEGAGAPLREHAAAKRIESKSSECARLTSCAIECNPERTSSLPG